MNYDSRPDTYAHIQTVQFLLGHVIRELLCRQEDHDQSKLASPEREVFDEFTPKLRDSTYGSEEYQGYLEAMGEALKHHYKHNQHHPEYHPEGIRGMSLVDVLEMLCDWLAATKRHRDGDIRRSIEQNAARFGYGDELKRMLLNTLPLLESDE
jgi:hypothetical protein